MVPYLVIAGSSIAVYIFIVLAIRIFGKNEISQLSIIDLVFILLISNSVQNAMVGNNSTLLGGLVAASSLFIVNWILRNFLFRDKGINKFIQGSPVMLVYRGKIIGKHLKQTSISVEELETAVREHGVPDVKHVDLAILEVDGNISILSHNYSKRSTRRRVIHRMLNKSS